MPPAQVLAIVFCGRRPDMHALNLQVLQGQTATCLRASRAAHERLPCCSQADIQMQSTQPAIRILYFMLLDIPGALETPETSVGKAVAVGMNTEV